MRSSYKASSKGITRRRRDQRWTRIREAIWERDDGRCIYCDSPADVVDHVVPLAKGGPNWPSNLVLACTACNRLKKANLPLDMLARAFYYLMTVDEDISWVDRFYAEINL